MGGFFSCKLKCEETSSPYPALTFDFFLFLSNCFILGIPLYARVLFLLEENNCLQSPMLLLWENTLSVSSILNTLLHFGIAECVVFTTQNNSVILAGRLVI